jgi:D-galactose 1-dehydrogenase
LDDKGRLSWRPVSLLPNEAEYRGIYRRFVELVSTGASDVDLAPFQLVADAFMLGAREAVGAFEE